MVHINSSTLLALFLVSPCLALQQSSSDFTARDVGVEGALEELTTRELVELAEVISQRDYLDPDVLEELAARDPGLRRIFGKVVGGVKRIASPHNMARIANAAGRVAGIAGSFIREVEEEESDLFARDYFDLELDELD